MAKHVFKYDDGSYMSRSWNYLTRGNVTSELQDARVFSGAGPAKNAARVAGVADKGRPVPIGLVLQELPL